MLVEAGKHYGEGIIKEYSMKLTKELGKGYTFTDLTRMKKFFILQEKVPTLSAKITRRYYKAIFNNKNGQPVVDQINIESLFIINVMTIH